jgi:hypothetical protein
MSSLPPTSSPRSPRGSPFEALEDPELPVVALGPFRAMLDSSLAACHRARAPLPSCAAAQATWRAVAGVAVTTR